MNQKTKMTFKPLTATAMKALCTEIKETKITSNQLKKFTVVDLWAIQKNRKSAGINRTLAL